jgi:hypothetical protein
MAKKIKDLNAGNKEGSILLKKERETINHQTGELISKEDLKISKEKNREKFIKVFIDNLDYIIEALKPIEKSIFFVLMHQMNYHNIISLNSTIRKTIQISLGLSQSAVSKGINALIEKKVLLKVEKENAEKFHISFWTDREFLINPQLIGSGSFKELSKIRRVITTTFDFDTFEATKEIDSAYVYSDFEEVGQNLENYEIKQIENKSSSDQKNNETQILIGEKDLAEEVEVISSSPSASPTNFDVAAEKEYLKLKIRSLELEKEIKDADNEKLRLQIELAKIGG